MKSKEIKKNPIKNNLTKYNKDFDLDPKQQEYVLNLEQYREDYTMMTCKFMKHSKKIEAGDLLQRKDGYICGKNELVIPRLSQFLAGVTWFVFPLEEKEKDKIYIGMD
jgi:hypothetical protein